MAGVQGARGHRCALALFTFVSYIMKGDINPITGEKQPGGMSFDQEIDLGLESRSEMAA